MMAQTDTVFVYILRCADDRFYVGTTRGSLEKRVAEHHSGTYGGYTKRRRPVKLVFQQSFGNATDAIAMERRIKGWSRAKKEALIRGDFKELKRLAKPPAVRGEASFDTRAPLAAQDEDG